MKNKASTLTFIILVLSCCAVANAQEEPCTLGLEKSPALRGVRLGMTIQDAKARHPDIVERNERDAIGRSDAIYLHFTDIVVTQNLKGIESLFLQVFAGKVFYISIEYEKDSGKEAVEIARSVGLSDKEFATIDCRGFSLSLYHYSDKLTITLSDRAALNTIAARTAELEEDAGDCQQSPVIRGLELGTSLAQFRKLYPRALGIRERREVGETVFDGVNKNNPQLQGVNGILVYFLDGALYFLVIDYSSQIQWHGIDQFVEVFSKGVGLRTKWQGIADHRTLRCRAFVVTADFKDGHPRITIQDRAATVKLNKREAQLKSPSTFRP